VSIHPSSGGWITVRRNGQWHGEVPVKLGFAGETVRVPEIDGPALCQSPILSSGVGQLQHQEQGRTRISGFAYSNFLVSSHRTPAGVYMWRDNRVASAVCGWRFGSLPRQCKPVTSRHLVGAVFQVNKSTKFSEHRSPSGHHACLRLLCLAPSVSTIPLRRIYSILGANRPLDPPNFYRNLHALGPGSYDLINPLSLPRNHSPNLNLHSRQIKALHPRYHLPSMALPRAFTMVMRLTASGYTCRMT